MSLKSSYQSSHVVHGLTREDILRMARQHKTQRLAVLSSAIRESGEMGSRGEPLPDITRHSVHRMK